MKNLNLRSASELPYQFTDSVQDRVYDLFANGVVSPGVVVGCIFLSRDQLFGVEELAVWSCAHLVCGDDKQI